MAEASDFERILSLLTESLKTVDLTFGGCEIDVLGEPVENPDLLDLSKLEAGQMDITPGKFRVAEMVDLCVSTVSPLVGEGVELVQDVAEDIEEANTDKVRLQQMIINLLSNAIKFTESGTITVTARSEKGNQSAATPTHDSRSPSEALAQEGPHDLTISVSDTGKGIPAEELPTIFDEYRQVRGSDADHKGTGLGLSVTKRFAELLGGAISVVSEVGQGTTFTVTLPAHCES